MGADEYRQSAFVILVTCSNFGRIKLKLSRRSKGQMTPSETPLEDPFGTAKRALRNSIPIAIGIPTAQLRGRCGHVAIQFPKAS